MAVACRTGSVLIPTTITVLGTEWQIGHELVRAPASVQEKHGIPAKAKNQRAGTYQSAGLLADGKARSKRRVEIKGSLSLDHVIKAGAKATLEVR